jgi:hypothetical protein
MTEHEIRVELHKILDSHEELLDAVRAASKAHDAAIVSAIEANRAAIRLLNRLMDEGVSNDGAS